MSLRTYKLEDPFKKAQMSKENMKISDNVLKSNQAGNLYNQGLYRTLMRHEKETPRQLRNERSHSFIYPDKIVRVQRYPSNAWSSR